MEKELTIKEVIEMLEKPIVGYVRHLMSKAGMEITETEAENLLSNVGLSIYSRRKNL